MKAALRTLGPNENGVTTHVKPPGRESRQDTSDLDSKIDIFSRALANIRRQVRPKTLAWKPYIPEAVDFVNKKRIRHGRAMGVAPDKAVASFEAAKGGTKERGVANSEISTPIDATPGDANRTYVLTPASTLR